MSFKPPKIDPKQTYLLKHKDSVSFVSQLTPILNGPIGNARRFDGKWLIESCWRWWTFHQPIELNEAFKIYHTPIEQVVKRVQRKTSVKGQKIVGIKSLSKSKAHAKPVRRLLKAARKRR